MESDLPPRLKEFLITLGDDSPVIKLLKVVNQALIATAVTKIKMYFMGHFVLKDVRYVLPNGGELPGPERGSNFFQESDMV